jgi:glycerol kinase
MPAPFILAIDQGIHQFARARCRRGRCDPRVGQRPFKQHFPRPGWVEHDPEEIWSTTLDAMAQARSAAGVEAHEIAAVGVTNQRETVVIWERSTGAPVGNAIVWQDRRTAAICDELRDAGHESTVTAATGLTIDPYFSGTKLTWLMRQDRELRARARASELAAGTVDTWLIHRLTGGRRHVTDFTNASRTLLFNINDARWDEGLCDLLEAPRSLLPEVQPSRSAFGATDPDVLGASIPILGVAGDQQSALFGQACLAPGQAKNTYGTGCFLLANAGTTRPRSQNRLLVSMGANSGGDGPEYILEGSIFVAGALVQWLRDGLGMIRESAEIERLAATVPDSGGVTIVPAFAGLGAPDWDPYARGTILGLTRGTGRGHIARAALEAIALSSADLLSAMDSDLPQPIAELRVDGGAAANNLLMQIQADLAGVPVVRPQELETTALGAAYLAGLGENLGVGRGALDPVACGARLRTPNG